MQNTIPYTRQSIDEEDIAAVVESLKSPYVTRGPKTEEFEENLANYCGAKYAVSFNSGSTALMAAAYAAKVDSFDHYISSCNTFIASFSAAIKFSANYVFTDIDPQTGNATLEDMIGTQEQKLSRGKRVFCPVHFAGLAMDIARLEQSLKDPESIIIEDAAHALGSSYHSGNKVGNCEASDMCIFSFHPAKTITTGEGGMVTTNQKDIFEALRLFRNNGLVKDKEKTQAIGPWYYEVHELSSNYHLCEMQAALGISQLKKLDSFVQRKQEIVKRYRSNFKDCHYIQLIDEQYDERTAFHLLSTQIDFSKLGIEKKELMLKLKEKGICSQVHYIPLYRHPYFENKISFKHFPNAETFYEKQLSLPLFSNLKDQEVDEISEAVMGIMRDYA